MGNARTSISYLWADGDSNSSPKYIKEMINMDYEIGSRLDRIEQLLIVIAEKLDIIETEKPKKKRVG